MSKRYFVDAVSSLYSHGDVVKFDFVNFDNKDGEVGIEQSLGIAMTMSSFIKMRETMNELYDKLTNGQSEKKEMPKVSLKNKKKKSE